MKLNWNGRTFDVEYREGTVTVTPHGGEPETFPIEFDRKRGRVKTDDGWFPFAAVRDRGRIWVSAAGETACLEIPLPSTIEGAGSGEIRSPMTGQLVSVRVKEGQKVATGEVLAVVTAMKMEYRLEAPFDGTVESVDAQPDSLVDLGQTILRLTEK